MPITVATTTHITMRGLIVARMAIIACAVGVLGMDLVISDRSLIAWRPGPTNALAYLVVMAAWLAGTVIEYRRLKQARELSELWAGGHLLVDVVAITILLTLSGGATNPFTLFYVVPVTLAIVVSPRWTWIVAGAGLLGFASLFLVESSPHHHGHFEGHLRGMWVAFAVTGALVAFTVSRIAVRIERERVELEQLREYALVDRHLTQIGTLAAGAAHELGTPLATLTLLAGELSHMDKDALAAATKTIKVQIARCKRILHDMATPELRAVSGADLEPWRLADLAEILGKESHTVVELDDPIGTVVALPKGGVTQIVRELLTNARSAGDAQDLVNVRIARTSKHVIIDLVDQGPGMSAEVANAAFDPFFSTKTQGQNVGLGLYIARAQARLLGGTVELTNADDGGARATLRLPTDMSET